MKSILLSKITKDYLNREGSARERYRLGWAGSVLVGERKGSFLLELRERFAGLFANAAPVIVLMTPPKLAKPLDPPPASFRPQVPFSRGALDKKKLEPIVYLLTETNETAKARPVPEKSFLFRSLCKGKGVLKQNSEGLVYLDIDNKFISMMLPYLKMNGLVRPPYFNLFGAPEGAHVPVIPTREVAFQYLSEIEQIGQEFSFEIEGLYSMEPNSWPEVEQVWFFKVKSDGLENLRRKHFLTTLPSGHDFHIAVAVKPHVTKMDRQGPLPLMRINTAFSAA